MKEQDQTKRGFNPTRRQFLKLTVGSLVGFAASHIIPPSLAAAQDIPPEFVLGAREINPVLNVPDPTHIGPIQDYEQPITDSWLAITSDAEASNLGFSDKEDVGGNLTRYSFPSRLEGRPNILIAEKGGEVIFKRRVLMGSGFRLTVPQFGFTLRYNFQATVPAPRFYASRGSAFATMVTGSQGAAIVIDERIQEIAEIQAFMPWDVDEYKRKWSQGDYS